MSDLKSFYWHIHHEDEIWTNEPESRFVATFENPDYPENSKVAEYIVDMHNAHLDKIENSSPFNYEKFISELQEGA